MLKRILKWVAVGVAVVALAIGAFVLLLLNPEWRMPSQTGPDGVALRLVAGCNDALKWNESNRVETVSKSDGALKVLVLAKATCGPEVPVKPRASIQGNAVELSWSWWRDPIGMFAKCECTRHIEFSVPNVQGDSPKVTLASKIKRTHEQ